MLTSSQYKQYGQHIWLMFAIYLSYITFINKSAICFLTRETVILEVYRVMHVARGPNKAVEALVGHVRYHCAQEAGGCLE